jgi:purine-binding chemotaxis protein CheW
MYDSSPSDPGTAALPCAALPMLPLQALTQGFDFGEPDEPEQAPPEAAFAQPAAPQAVAARLSGMQSRQGFRIGNLRLMIRYEDGSELTELAQIFRMPNTPHWMVGMVNLHGLLIPVFDLAAYLGIERDETERRLLLVLGHGADAAGMLIDGMPERLRWDADHQIDAEMAPSRLTPHLSGGGLINEALWFDLQYKSLLNALEADLGAAH